MSFRKTTVKKGSRYVSKWVGEGKDVGRTYTGSGSGLRQSLGGKSISSIQARAIDAAKLKQKEYQHRN